MSYAEAGRQRIDYGKNSLNLNASAAETLALNLELLQKIKGLAPAFSSAKTHKEGAHGSMTS